VRVYLFRSASLTLITMNPANEGVTEAVQNVIKVLESQIDEQLERLEQPDEDELSNLRAMRLKELKQRQSNQRKWLEAGHGEYTELATEKDFFSTCTASDKVVAHFYRQSTGRCEIVDMHMKKLAPLHLETKFVKLNVEKAPFLTERLNIRVIPTILVSVGGTVRDRIVGFSTLGNVDDFSTEMMEWRLAQADGVDYAGDKTTPPAMQPPKKSFLIQTKKTIRGNTQESDEDE